ncbi:YihY/virulence factor BrkB family protein [Nocardia puris]|uniref:Membrane protein n=1 Tax=Nocardia puris TaxID=208602 RepID=A0A366E249_9NOCA|nr:YihY/virulence factor BrkB family protein [Nocardia puris]MBF6212733.1 YihY/virulence factor BrkB family protein [Nocardia puris]MBF6367670.1 YihY/virulence factor BrkB family protein [Nocardia puris]RBO96446.1 membrane protein [Nocardia puris]
MSDVSALPEGAAWDGEEPVHSGGGGVPPRGPAAAARRVRHGLRQARRLVVRVAVKAWHDSIFAKSAAAAFWQTLSLAPLLLGVLGSLGYVGGWFGPDTVEIVNSKIITFSRELFSPAVVNDLIEPTVADVLGRGRGAVVSVGFVLSLWAGSSAMATFVDAIVEAHDQKDARHPVWQRIFALLLYVQFLVAAVLILPLVALGPTLIGRVLPDSWREPGLRLVDSFYYPGVGLLLIVGLTTLYKLALHRTLPWHRLFGGALVAGVFFMAASEGLRRYLSWITETGVSYGALATPIAFLLFTFSLGFAVILGAEFNAAVQEFWPARATRIEQMKEWWTNQVRGDDEEATVSLVKEPVAKDDPPAESVEKRAEDDGTLAQVPDALRGT